MKNTFYLFLALFLCYNVSNAQLNTELLAEMDYSQNLSDVWGYTAPDGTEYALVGVRNGLSIVSLDDPENPIVIHPHPRPSSPVGCVLARSTSTTR